MTARPSIPHFGHRLRRLRRLRGVKQGAVADLAGVTQTTISRWESGALTPDADVAARILIRLAGGFGGQDDAPLRRLVEASRMPVHLVVDADHRLLAASAAREEEWQRSAAELLGQSLWRYATEAIQAAEAELVSRSWWQAAAPQPVEVCTGQGSAGLRIAAGVMLWERLYLADGTPVRLCTSIASA